MLRKGAEMRISIRRSGLAALAGLMACAGGPVQAADAADAAGNGAAADGGGLGFLEGLGNSNGLLGDMGGLRPWLGEKGITFTLSETSEVLGNVSGGNRRGFEYDGLTTATLQMDTARAFGWEGGTVNISGLQIHGRNLSADNLASLQTASGIEADRGTRLWEAWYQQAIFGGKADVKLGQQSLDQEFMVSQNALLFVNTMFVWPMLPSADLPGGGPAYPLSDLGARLRLHAGQSVTLLAGVFNGSPSPRNGGDPQLGDRTGTDFTLKGAPLAMTELQYATPPAAAGLPGTYKLGAWYDGRRFADQSVDSGGGSLAAPGSTGVAAGHHGNYAFYGVADQMIWRDAAVADHNANTFLRLMGTPQQDRVPIVFSLNAGLTLHAPFQGRTADTAGLGLGYTRVSHRLSELDEETGAYNGGFYPVRHSETFLEATYQYALASWWQLQPDVQYVFHPGGNVPQATDSGERVGDELVLGLRTNIQF